MIMILVLCPTVMRFQKKLHFSVHAWLYRPQWAVLQAAWVSVKAGDYRRVKAHGAYRTQTAALHCPALYNPRVSSNFSTLTAAPEDTLSSYPKRYWTSLWK